jgi:hypothetical protein
MSLRMPTVPLTQDDLNRLANPASASDGETFNHIYYDTQSYPSGGTGSLTFFSTTNTDKTMCNLDQAGQLAAGYYHKIMAFTLDPLDTGTNFTATTTGVRNTGIANDLNTLFNVARATITFYLQSKPYGPWPLAALHGLGGINVYAAGAYAATTQTQYANNSFPDGEFWQDGGLIISPQMSFYAVLNFAASPTITTTLNLRLSMPGNLTRPIR